MIPPHSVLPIVDAVMRAALPLRPTAVAAALAGASAVVQTSTDGASCC